MEIYDPYPVETKWRQSIANIDTPLHYLEYGIMSEMISDIVQDLHKNNRHNKIVKLIKKIHNDRLDDVWKEIISDAKKLPNYCKKNWLIGKKNKIGRVQFFEKNDISIQYLEQAIEVQNKGNPEFKPGDLVMDESSRWVRPCIIREKIKRGKYYNADVCKVDYVRDTSSNTVKYKPVPIWHRYQRVNPNGGGPRLTIKVDSWKCKKVGVETKKIIKDRIEAIERYNNELEKRKKFYNDIIRPLLEPESQGLLWSYQTFHNQKIDVWNLKNPPEAPWQLQTYAYPHRLIRWNTEWEIIIDTISDAANL